MPGQLFKSTFKENIKSNFFLKENNFITTRKIHVHKLRSTLLFYLYLHPSVSGQMYVCRR